MTNTGSPIELYIQNCPLEHHANLQLIRHTILEVVPTAKEKISYRMPTFVYYGNLIHFALFKHHYGLYPGSAPIEAFKDQLKDYHFSKGAIQFPFDKPLPLNFIKDIVKFAVQLQEKKVQLKKIKRRKVDGTKK